MQQTLVLHLEVRQLEGVNLKPTRIELRIARRVILKRGRQKIVGSLHLLALLIWKRKGSLAFYAFAVGSILIATRLGHPETFIGWRQAIWVGMGGTFILAALEFTSIALNDWAKTRETIKFYRSSRSICEYVDFNKNKWGGP